MSVSQLDTMVERLNDTSSMKAGEIRALQRQVSRLEPVAALLSQYKHIRSEVCVSCICGAYAVG